MLLPARMLSWPTWCRRRRGAWRGAWRRSWGRRCAVKGVRDRHQVEGSGLRGFDCHQVQKVEGWTASLVFGTGRFTNLELERV